MNTKTKGKVLKKPPPDPVSEPLPHGAKPMWVSIEEWILIQCIDHKRYTRRKASLDDICKWVDNWYRDRGPGVLVDHGTKGYLLYQLITAYPEDRELILERRKKKGK
jgi:hypothetical protein